MEELKVLPLSGPKSPVKSPKRPPPLPLTARVRVAVRVRPLATSNGGVSPSLCITGADPETDVNSSENMVHFQFEKTQKSFRFDHIFSTEAAQSDVYNGALQPLLASMLHGFNVTVLAYGQTGSGKTYTMGGARSSASGSDSDDGLIPNLLRDLFEALRNDASMKTTAKVSFSEIYCDEIRDLLADGSERPRSSSQNGIRQNSTPRLTIHEDNYDVWVEGLQQVKVKSVDDALRLLKTGRQRQTIGAHALNDQSSRSHAVYTLEVSRTFANEIKRAKLTFVDLAGSERVKKTLLEGQGMKEGSHINIGLLALGNVINALGSRHRHLQRRNSTGVSSPTSNIPSRDDIAPLGLSHVPYRSSKLTRLLRDALGGNSVTLFIACISPETTNGSETLCTLQYANRARSIQNKAQKNVEEAVPEDVDNEASVLHGTESAREIYDLREQVAALKLQLEQAVAATKAAEARDASLVEDAQYNSIPSRSKPENPVTSKSRRYPKSKRQLRIAPFELDLPEFANIREMSCRLESEHREGIISKSTGQLHQEAFSIDSNTANTTNQASPEQQEPHVPDVTELSAPVVMRLVPTFPNVEIITCNEKATAQSAPVPANESINTTQVNTTQTGDEASQGRIPSREMIDQSTQYDPPCHQNERKKTPVDYVLLSPSQIFREVHNQKQKVLAGAPSPWPHRRRLDVQHNESRNCSATYLALNLDNDTSSTSWTKTPDVLQDLLQRTRQLIDNNQDLWELDSKPEVEDPEQSPLLFEAFVDNMAELYAKRSRQHHFVHRLTQRFRHLTSLLIAADVDNQMNELSKYTLEHQQTALQQHLEAFELLAADRLWARLQHREVAIENFAEGWNDKLAEVFLSDDQYEACTPWHEHREDHEFFQHRILPFILNGWISVTPGDLENEQLWLTL